MKINISKAIKVLLKLLNLKLKYRNHIIFVALSGIGDICYCFSFIDEMKNNRKKKVLVLTKPYTYSVVKSFPAVDSILCLDVEDITLFSNINLPEKFRPVFNKHALLSNIFLCTPLTEDTYKNLNRQHLDNYIDILKQQINSKRSNIQISYPVVPDTDISRFNFIDLKRIIIINPYSNSLDFNNNSIFQKIADRLNNKGYCVYTNTVGNQQPLDGTSELNCNLQELYHISRQCALLISIRSGIVDFSIGNSGTFLVLYNNMWNGKFRQAYSLDGWKTDSKIFEFDYKDEKEIFSMIDTFLQTYESNEENHYEISTN